MRLIIENDIELVCISEYDLNFLKKMNVWINEDNEIKTVLAQKVDLPQKQLTKVMQIIEDASKKHLVIRWFPDPKFYMYTQEFFFKIFVG